VEKTGKRGNRIELQVQQNIIETKLQKLQKTKKDSNNKQLYALLSAIAANLNSKK
jgi:hypothetical protein